MEDGTPAPVELVVIDTEAAVCAVDAAAAALLPSPPWPRGRIACLWSLSRGCRRRPTTRDVIVT